MDLATQLLEHIKIQSSALCHHVKLSFWTLSIFLIKNPIHLASPLQSEVLASGYTQGIECEVCCRHGYVTLPLQMYQPHST